MSKYAEFQRAEAELQAAMAKFNKLKEDKTIQRIEEFKEKLTALMEEYEVTSEDLLVAGGIPTKNQEPKSKRSERPMRRFTRLKTGHVHEGKNPNKKIRAWIAEDGEDGVKIEDM